MNSADASKLLPRAEPTNKHLFEQNWTADTDNCYPPTQMLSTFFHKLHSCVRIALNQNDPSTFTNKAWMDNASKWHRWISLQCMTTNPLGIIHAFERPLIINSPNVDRTDYIHHQWINFSATSYIDVNTMNNICQGRIKLGDVLRENMTGQIMLAVASVFKGESLSEPAIDLMLFKYDEEKDVMFWKDDSGNCFDLDRLKKEDLHYPIHSRLD